MYRIPLVFTPQPEGGYTVTSPALPELITEGDTLEEAQANVQDAFEAVVEIYSEQNRALRVGSIHNDSTCPRRLAASITGAPSAKVVASPKSDTQTGPRMRPSCKY